MNKCSAVFNKASSDEVRELEQDKSPVVSIIVPCYNSGKYLMNTLSYIQQQTLVDWECILVDDGSTDDTEQIARLLCSQDDRFRYYYQTNKRQQAARNNGLKQAQGRYVKFIDSDDMISPNCLEVQVRALSSTSELAMANSDFQYCNELGEPISVGWKARTRIDENEPLMDVIKHWASEISMPPGVFLYDARLFTECGIEYDEQINGSEDFDLLMSVLEIKPIMFYQNEKLASYRIVPNSLSRNRGDQRIGYRQIIDKHLPRHATEPEVIAALRRKRRSLSSDLMDAAPVYEIDWWIYHTRIAIRKFLPKAMKQKLKKIFCMDE